MKVLITGATGFIGHPLTWAMLRRGFLSRELADASYVCFRYSSARAENELGVHFRPIEQAWRDTLEAARASRHQ